MYLCGFQCPVSEVHYNKQVTVLAIFLFLSR